MIDRAGYCLLLLCSLVLLGASSTKAAPNSPRTDSLMEEPPPSVESPKPLPAEAPATVESEAKPPAKAHELHRLDFRMEGKSCPVCLLSIQKTIKSFNGVEDAAVMLKRPFGVSVIYQNDKTKSDEIISALRVKDPVIKIFDVSDKKVDSIPLPLIPPFVPAPAVEAPKNVPDSAVYPANGGL